MKYERTQQGFSTLEMLIAMTIIILALTSITLISFGNQTMLVDAETNTEALHMAQAMIENTQSLARKDFNLVNPATSTEMVGSMTYAKKVIVETSLDGLTKHVMASVSWAGERGRTLHVSLSTLVTNYTNALGADTCDSVLTGDWKTPITKNISTGLVALSGVPTTTYIPTSVDAYKGRLYVTIGDTGAATDPTFLIFDIQKLKTDPDHALLGKIDNATTTQEGLYSVRVAEGTTTGSLFAYVANKHKADWSSCTQSASCAQLQVIEVTDPQHPKVLPTANYKIVTAGSVPQVTGNSGQGVGYSISFKDGFVFLGLTRTANGPEFNIIDVHDPLHPTWVGGRSIGSTINGITVSGSTAYLATNDPSAEFQAIDVSNLTAPGTPKTFDAIGGGGTIGLGQVLYKVGDIIYLGRTNIPGNSPELYILDASSSATSIRPLGSLDMGAAENGLVVRSGLAFLAGESVNGFRILDIRDPANIADWAPPYPLPNGSLGSALDCEGNDIFVTSRDASNNGYLSVITASP